MKTVQLVWDDERDSNSMLMASAVFQPSSINEEARTIDVIFATESEIPTIFFDGESAFPINEILLCDTKYCNLERYAVGAPILDNHDKSKGTKGVLGVTMNPRFVNGSGVVTLRFDSTADAVEVFRKIREGFLKTVSVGYRVFTYEVTMKESGRDTYRAIEWEVLELSVAPIPADIKAQIRSATGQNKQSFQMKVTDPTTEPTTETKEPVVVAPGADTDKARKAGQEAERTRVLEIKAACRSANLDSETEEKYIADGLQADAVRKLIIDGLASKTPVMTPPAPSVNGDENIQIRTAAALAMLARSGATLTAEERNRAADYTGFRVLDLAKFCLERAGVSVKGMTESRVLERATSSTSDFPVILQEAINRELLAAYQLEADTWTRFCKIGSVNDFKTHHRIRTGSLGDLMEVQENGEYKVLSIPDGKKETIRAKPVGALINLSREMMINDDLGAFRDLATALGRSSKRTIEKAVYALFAMNSGAGPTMNDGLALFHATHANIGTGSALSVAGIDADRVQMSLQMDNNSNDYLNLTPTILLISTGLEGSAKVINNSAWDHDGTKLQKPNMVAGLFKDIIGTPRVSGTTRYLFANPMIEPTIEVVFLNGEQNPYFEQSQEFKSDGIWYKCRHDFGTGAIGFKGVIKNAGA